MDAHFAYHRQATASPSANGSMIVSGVGTGSHPGAWTPGTPEQDAHGQPLMFAENTQGIPTTAPSSITTPSEDNNNNDDGPQIMAAPPPTALDRVKGVVGIINNGTANAVDGAIDFFTGVAFNLTHSKQQRPGMFQDPNPWRQNLMHRLGDRLGSTDLGAAYSSYGAAVTDAGVKVTTAVNGAVLTANVANGTSALTAAEEAGAGIDIATINEIKALPANAELTSTQIAELSKKIDAVLNKSLPAKAAAGRVEDIVKLLNEDARFRFIDQVPGAREKINNALAQFGASL